MRRILVSLLLALMSWPALAAESATPPDPLGRAQGGFIAISVADVAMMSTWYQEKLGLAVVGSGETPDKIVKFVLLQGAGLVVELIQHGQAQPRSKAAPALTESYQIHGIFKAGLIVAELDHLYEGLKKKGVTIAHDIMPAQDVPMRSFIVEDPEGNLVQFFGK